MSFTSPSARSRWSDVYVSASVQLVSTAGALLVMTTLVLSLQQRGASGVEVAALVVAESLPMVVLGRVVGWLADRFDSRVLLVLAGVGQVAAAQVLVRADEFGWIIVGGIALATASAVAGPTRSALLPAMVTRDDLPRAIAVGQTALAAGTMVGPALAGFLVAAQDVRHTLEITSWGFVATTVGGVLLRTRRRVAAGPSSVDKTTVEWRLRQDRVLWSAIWGFTAIVGAVSAVNVAAVFFVRATLGASASAYGMVEAAWTAGMLIGAWLIARRVSPQTTDATVVRWVFASLGLGAAVVAGVGFAPTVAWVIPAYVLGGLLNGGQNVMAATLMGRRTPPAARGRTAAAMHARVQGGTLVGFIAGGLALEYAQPRWVIVGAGALGLAVVAIVTPLVRRAIRPTPTVDARPAMSAAGRVTPSVEPATP
jgi:MFS family permease